MQADDLFSVFPDEIYRIDTAADQPVQIRTEFEIRNAGTRALQIVHAVVYLEGVIVQVRHGAFFTTHFQRSRQHSGLRDQFLSGFPAMRVFHGLFYR